MGDRVRMALPARLIDDPEPRRDLDAEVDYPSSDGLALHGTNRHALAVHLAVEALRSVESRFKPRMRFRINPCRKMEDFPDYSAFRCVRRAGCFRQ